MSSWQRVVAKAMVSVALASRVSRDYTGDFLHTLYEVRGDTGAPEEVALGVVVLMRRRKRTA